MVQLTAILTTFAVAASTVSALCDCTPGVKYCGYALLNGTFGCTAPELPTNISTDRDNSLYQCNADGSTVTQIQFCGGSGTCQPANHVGGGCDGTNSCCDPPAVLFFRA